MIADWCDHENITAIVWAGLPGQESGNAIADILYGDANPGGKSPFTWAYRREDYGADVLYDPNERVPQSDFGEGVFTDYRALDRSDIDPLFEFGFGLSYTTFEYSKLIVEKKKNVSTYEPATGFTDSAPRSENLFATFNNMHEQSPLILANTSSNLADFTFPDGFEALEAYIYPWLDSDQASEASKSTDYDDGNVEYIPQGAHDSESQPLLPAGGGSGGNPGLYEVLYAVTTTIKNTGKTDGDEVVQMVSSRPPRRLVHNTWTCGDPSNDDFRSNWLTLRYANKVR